MSYDLHITPMLSIRPNRISLTQSVVRRFKQENGTFINKFTPHLGAEKISAPHSGAPLKKLEKKFHNFNISVNSQRNLRDKISYLFQYAKARNIKTSNGKNLKNFKVAFITLTLPSKQVHPTAEITETCLNDFLQKCRRYLDMKNYVWRMEFQKNGNVHYHLATDTYIDYYWLLKEWNRSLDLLGYVSRYAQANEGTTYTEYLNRYKYSQNFDHDKIYKRYLQNVKYSWRNPNSVDVKNARNSDNISYYISKYFSKNEKGAKCNDLDNEENSFALRLCFWSRSLSKCKGEAMPLDYYAANILELFKRFSVGFRKVYDYATVIYYSFFELPPVLKNILGRYFRQTMLEDNYIPAG